MKGITIENHFCVRNASSVDIDSGRGIDSDCLLISSFDALFFCEISFNVVNMGWTQFFDELLSNIFIDIEENYSRSHLYKVLRSVRTNSKASSCNHSSLSFDFHYY